MKIKKRNTENNRQSMSVGSDSSKYFIYPPKNSIYSSYFRNNNYLFNLEFNAPTDHRLLSLIKVRNLDSNYYLFKVKYSRLSINAEWHIAKSNESIFQFLNFLINDSEFDTYFQEHKGSIEKLVNKREICKNFLNDTIKLMNMVFAVESLKRKIYVLEFCEISIISFITLSQGIKHKEGYINKQIKEVSKCSSSMCCLFSCLFHNFKRKWFVVRKDMIFYIDSSSDYMGKNVSC